MRIARFLLTCFVISLFAFCLLSTGCQKEQGLKGLSKIKGKLTLKGEPVEGASIALSPVASGGEARAAGAITDAKGEFIIQTLQANDGAFPGEYLISVRKMVVDQTYTEEEVQAATAQGKTLYSTATNVIPAKYAKTATSGLKVTVVSGKNEDLMIDLE